MKDFAVSVVFLFISVFTFISSQRFNAKGERASSLAYNSALYPRLIASVLFFLSIVLLVQSIRKGALKSVKVSINKQKVKKTIRFLFIVLLYITGINYLGYIPSSIICILLLIYLYDGTVKQGIICSVAITISLYLVFRIGFRIPLPVGKLVEYWMWG